MAKASGIHHCEAVMNNFQLIVPIRLQVSAVSETSVGFAVSIIKFEWKFLKKSWNPSF